MSALFAETRGFVVKARRKASSLVQYRTRALYDTCLHDDVYDFVSKHDISNERLLEMLLDNQFSKARFSNPEYPA